MDSFLATPCASEWVYVRRYAILLRYLLLRIDVDLDKLQFPRLCFLLSERLENRRDSLARPAPIGVEVYDCVRGGVEERFEVGGAGYGDYFARHFGVVTSADVRRSFCVRVGVSYLRGGSFGVDCVWWWDMDSLQGCRDDARSKLADWLPTIYNPPAPSRTYQSETAA